MSRFPPVLGKLVLSLAGTALALCLLESIFRAAVALHVVDFPEVPDSDAILHRYSANPALVYEMKPSHAVSFTGVLVATNRWGIRDSDYALTKPPGVVRIAVIGDSVAFGLGLRKEDTFAKQLEAQLNTLQRGRYQVINFSVVGYNSAQEEIVLKEKVIGVKPDMVILAFYMNDDSYTDGLRQLVRELHPSSLGPRLHSKLLGYLLHRRERRRFESLASWSRVDRLFEQLSILGSREGFRTLITVFPTYFDDVRDYPAAKKHRTVGAFAAKHSLPLIDLLELWGRLSPIERKRRYLPDDVDHLSVLGMRDTTRELRRFIQASKFPALNRGALRRHPLPVSDKKIK